MSRLSIVLFLILTIRVCVDGVVREKGTRGNTYFYHAHDGFHYHLNSHRANVYYFKCVQYERGCRGRAQLSEHGFEHTQAHAHPRDILFPQEMRLRRRILARCREINFVPFTQIIREERRRFPREVQVRINYCTLRTAMRNARISRYPPPPQTLEEFSDILQNRRFHSASMTVDGLDNFYAGSVTARNGSHHVLFASRRMLRFARRQTIFHGDGTFKSTPPASHVVQIFCDSTWNHRILPVAWVLMSSRTEEAYIAVFRMLRILLGPRAQVQRVITDYEAAQQNAWEEVFQGITLQGCFWHLCRAIVRYARVSLGLGIAMRCGRVLRIIRLCCAIALVPRRLMVTAFQVVVIEARDEGLRIYRLLRLFLSYIWRRWINHRQRRRWMCVAGSFHRTNNACESHNRMLSNSIGRVRHPNVYALLMAFANMEDDAVHDILAMRDGYRPNRRRRATAIANDARLTYLLRALPQRGVPPNNVVLRYLERAAYTFQHAFDDFAD